MFALRTAALFAAIVTTGLIAGLFFAYLNSVMPALRQADDRTFISIMQKINVVILNPWFMLCFMGAVGFSVLAVALHLGRDSRTVLWWLIAALVLNVIAFGITAAVNVPLNDQLQAAGDPATIADPHTVRAQFENTWVTWNIVRAVIHLLAFTALCGALYFAGAQHGRSAQAAPTPAAAVLAAS